MIQAQLLQNLHVIEYFAKSLKIIENGTTLKLFLFAFYRPSNYMYGCIISKI